MKNKNLLILGMGHSQVDLAKIARDNDINVFACAKDTSGPVKEYVTDCAEIDILDIDSIVRYAKEKEIDVVFSAGLEVALDPIAEVSEILNLNTFYSSKDLAKLKNKATWREALGDTKGNLKFISGSKAGDFEKWNNYPSILKPVDGSGQRGVVKISNFKELIDNFDRSISFSKSKKLIVEEFADGKEISVNSFMENNELKFFVMSDRISYEDLPGGIIKEHHIPSDFDYDLLHHAVRELVEIVNKKMNFKNGHIYFQMKIDGNKVYLIEFTPRFDGCHMWNLINHSMGINLLQVALENLFDGESVTLANYSEKKSFKNKYTLKFNSDIPNAVVDYDNYSSPENSLYNYWYYHNGDKVKSVTGILEKVGYDIIKNKV